MAEKVVIGNAELWHGDCREVLPMLPRCNAVVTDPPYEIRNKFGTSDLYGTRRMEFHFDTSGVTDDVVIPALALAFNLAQSFHVFCEPEQYAGIAAEARRAGMTPKPFAKVKLCSPPPMPGNWWPSGFELAIYGYMPGAWFGDTSGKRSNVVIGDSYRHGIRSKEKCDHPTQKWLPMIEKIVASIVEPGGVALDPFMGSGTTGVACMKLDRRFIGIEIERKYFDIACERIENAQRQGVMLLPDSTRVQERTGDLDM
jgi:site-specific DNA-methyltransferase (adenine-specific)